MRLHSISLIVLCALTLAIAAGRRPNDTIPGTDGNGVADTVQIEGTIDTIVEDQQMVIIGTTFGQDTVFYTNETAFPQGREQTLQVGAQVRIRALSAADRNTAIAIESQDENGNGADTPHEDGQDGNNREAPPNGGGTRGNGW